VHQSELQCLDAISMVKGTCEADHHSQRTELAQLIMDKSLESSRRQEALTHAVKVFADMASQEPQKHSSTAFH